MLLQNLDQMKKNIHKLYKSVKTEEFLKLVVDGFQVKEHNLDKLM